MSAKRGWSEQETAELLRLYESGASHRDIAAALGRSRQAIGYRLNSLGHRRNASTRGDDTERFWQYVDRGEPDACWEWTGYRDADGYGSFALWPTRIGAHRFAFESVNGPLEEGECVRHRCDNPPCVNPSHLTRGSIVENNRDKTLRGRDAKGERHGMARYTVEQVRDVKRRLARREPRAAIAAETGVPVTTIATIATGKQWREVTTA